MNDAIQTKIIKSLVSDKCIIGVIGDYNQSIYLFQGASPDDFRNFEIDDLQKYKIRDNHRCSKCIIDCLNSFTPDLDQIKIRDRVGEKPKIIVCEDQAEILRFIKTQENVIKDSHDKFTSVILTRTNADLRRLKMLSRNLDNISDDKWDEFQAIETDSKRFYLIKGLLTSYQYATDENFELSIKEFIKLFKRKPLNTISNTLKQRSTALEFLEYFINSALNALTLKDFYSGIVEKFKIYGVSLPNYRSGAASDFAQNNTVQELLENLKISDYKTDLITIHGAKGTEYNFVCITVLRDIYNKNYVLHCYRDKLEFPSLIRKIIEIHNVAKAKYKHSIDVLIEDRASGTQIIQTLKNDHMIYPIAINPEYDKKARLMGVSHLIENGSCLFPNNEPHWWPDLEKELLIFPRGKYDDQCDALSQVLNYQSQISIFDAVY